MTSAVRERFERFVYGAWPQDTAVRRIEIGEPRPTPRGRGTVVALRVETDRPALSFTAHLAVPVGRTTPVACLLGLNADGNGAAFGTAPPAGGAQSAGWAGGAWPVDRVLERGYALATVHASEVVPDSADAAVEALRHFAAAGADPDVESTSGTGALAAWAWALACAGTALGGRPDIDAGRIGLVGHSRFGKAALLAAAMDERFAMVAAAGSGCGGAAPWRTDDPGAESLESITTAFPHWFAGALADFRGRADDLPVEQSDLLRLCSPTPVLLTNGLEDAWANPRGQLAMLRAAGADDEGDTDPAWGELPLGTAHLGRRGWFLRDGGHAVEDQDWDACLAFADRWLGAT